MMSEALDPYYGGDQVTHANRILDAHLQGGRDTVGFFSTGQHSFVARQDSEVVGFLHIVTKRQSTMKISPLIVKKLHRHVAGVGSALLQHAESMARKSTSRQIYCTVAEANQEALAFFIRKGFVVVGASMSHYKQGVNELMLFKELVSEEYERLIDAPALVCPSTVHRYSWGATLRLMLKEGLASIVLRYRRRLGRCSVRR